jgi:hypothetical protein
MGEQTKLKLWRWKRKTSKSQRTVKYYSNKVTKIATEMVTIETSIRAITMKDKDSKIELEILKDLMTECLSIDTIMTWIKIREVIMNDYKIGITIDILMKHLIVRDPHMTDTLMKGGIMMILHKKKALVIWINQII